MKIIIGENKLMDIMFDYAQKNYPEFIMPLNGKLKFKGRGNSGWGSSMHDYNYYETIYTTKNGTIVLIENDDSDSSTNERWLVNEELEPLYSLFGLESFQTFFKKVHNIDLTDKRNKEYDWYFDSISQ